MYTPFLVRRSPPLTRPAGRRVVRTSTTSGARVTLVGRERVVRTLDWALARCASGEAYTVLVEAAAGCGKSELIDTFAERASQGGALVLQAVGSPAERALPLGVMRQLVNSARPGTLPQPAVAEDGLPATEAMHEFCAALRALTAETPVVACVDDLHHVDDASLRHLAHLLRHARSAAFLLVITSPMHDGSQDPDFRTELLRRLNFTRVRLEPLTEAQTALALADRQGPDQGVEPAGEFHARSGGNPLLLRALVEEYRSAAPQGTAGHPPNPAAGGLFAQAALTCLRRSGPGALAVAQALAVLGDDGTPGDVGRLLGTAEPDVAQRLTSIGASGIVREGRFCHPAVAAAVLDRMDAADRAALHRRAAEVLHDSGRPCTAVARHLVTAHRADLPLPDAPWVADVLREAAEHLISADDVRQAATVLELAHEADRDPQQRAEIKTRLAAITWRFNPSAAEQHLSAPLGMLRDDLLATERMEPLAALLATQGRIAEAGEVRALIAETLGEEYDTPAGGTDWPLPHLARDGEAAECERFLQTTALGDATLQPVARAIRTLIHSEQPERAASWCQQRLDEAARRGAPTWRATFATLQAEVMLRLGDLPGAEEHALRALDFLPQRSGNAFAGSPTAFLIRARTAMGRHAAVAGQLEQPMPDTLFRSVHGLSYLRARGLHYLATGQLRAALSDFLEVGRLMQRWGVDRPVVLPWRGDAAEALLRLGEPQRAEKLILQQLATPDARHSWVRGTSLRLRAAIHPSEQRPSLLNQAVEELRKSGDRVELARAMADLGQALQEIGEPAKAGALTRQAWSLAENCGAEPLREQILPGTFPDPRPAGVRVPHQGGAQPDAEYKLSESERRVATLAARGYTNRQISRELYITVSTVEQHLTRVYRKLSITRRQDLPADLQLASREIA
ncbi:AAA family ATPase [Streptomyces sp. NPDC008313]|uniref:AAA family ATPase n=1 Tax=Streptomyces sp. NPDC008313 TaxID=3364826 RepID=UPI0036E5B86C